MAISLKSTATVAADGVKLLVYGQAGAGKTSLIATLPSPVILSAEGGLLSLGWTDVPYVEIDSMERLDEAFDWLVGSQEAQQFQSVALDSISEIGEVILSAEKARTKDGRAAYGEMADALAIRLRRFRDKLPGRHVYFSAKLDKSADEKGRVMYAPSMPGKQTSQALPYYFDEVFALRVEQSPDGQTVRMLQTATDGLWQAKDRSGRLDPWEAPNLGAIISKMQGGAAA